MSDKNSTDTGTGKRRGGRRAGQKREATTKPRAPYIQRKLGTFNVLSEEGLSLIEHNADLLLQETGMEFHDDPEILAIFRNAGASVQGTPRGGISR